MLYYLLVYHENSREEREETRRNNNIKKVVHRFTMKINSHKRILPEMELYFNGNTLKIATKAQRHKETPKGLPVYWPGPLAHLFH